MTYLLDTNIIGYLMRGTYPSLTKKIFTIPFDGNRWIAYFWCGWTKCM